MSGDVDIRRKRALYRATHRGTKELDLMIGGFARAHLETFSAAELSVFEKLLTMQDPALQSWVLDGRKPEFAEFGALINDIRAFHGLAAAHVASH